MSLRFPALVQATTDTTGIGAYTVTETATPNGKRSFTQAVAAGDLADGDEVVYAVVDSSVPDKVELGRGTWDNSTKTLARTEVYQPNGTAVNWGAGERDVIVCDYSAICALLVNDQTVAGVKTFTDVLRAQLGGSPFGFDSVTALIAQNSGTAGATCRIAIIGGNTGTSELSLGDTDSQYRGRVIYNHATDVLTFYRAAVLGASLDAAGLKDASGNKVDAFESGTRFLLANNVVPSGWSIVASLADKTILTTSTASEIDDQGGSWTVSGVTIGNTTLSIAQMPAHTHGAAGHDLGSVVGTYKFEATRATADGTPVALATASEGGGGAHTHSFSQNGSWRPAYYKVGVIQKA